VDGRESGEWNGEATVPREMMRREREEVVRW